MRTLLLAAIVLAGCTSPPPPPEWCDGTTRGVYDPQHGGAIEVLPDDFWTLPDPDTETGLRIHLEVDQTPGLADYPPEYVSIFDHLSELDGWGLAGGATFFFDRPLDPSSLDEQSVAFIAFPAGGSPVRIEADVRLTDYDTTAILLPRRPLPAGTRAAAAVFTTARGLDGSCVAPSRRLRELLSPETELEAGIPPEVSSPRFVEAAEGLGRGLDEIAAMTVFTTQSAKTLSRRVAEDIRSRPPPELPPLVCSHSEEEGWTECDGTIPVLDYRGPDGVVAADSEGSPEGVYDLPVRFWLPGDGSGGPFPTLLYGHGLGSGRSQGGVLARRVVGEGVAVVAADAVEHGDHPGRREAPLEFLEPILFFGVTFSPPSIDGRVLRDNWRQTTFERLQLLQAIEAGLDVDGDGALDLDSARMAYVGISLGGIMGSELLALSSSFRGALLSVPGGRTTSIIQDSTTFAPLIELMAPPGTPPGDVERFFPLLQALSDPGDAMIWAPHVRSDRLDGAEPPQLLVQVALDDAIVPNSASDPLIRSLGLGGVGREVWSIPEVDFTAGPLEAAAAQQFDWVTVEGEEVPASHDNVTTSEEGWAEALAFVLAVLDGEVASISDPYGP